MSIDTPEGVEQVLLRVVPVNTFAGYRPLTSASGFLFRGRERLFLVTNRHVFFEEASRHFPDRVEIGLHTDATDMTRFAMHGVPLYRDGLSLWRYASDTGGEVDVAVLELDEQRLPSPVVVSAFDGTDLASREEQVRLGDALTVVGYPLGFHDTVHHLAVARSASIASAYGVRFQRQGYFLTDARTHRGSSGSPVLRRRVAREVYDRMDEWQLLGIHSTRMDMRSRDASLDESLGLNCAWYADVLVSLTQ